MSYNQTRSDILQGQALFRRDKQHLTKDVFCLSLSIKIKKYLSKIERGRERVVENRLERIYRTKQKSRKSKRKQRERESRESAEIDGE